MKTENEEWSVKTFRELLKRHIKAQEASDMEKVSCRITVSNLDLRRNVFSVEKDPGATNASNTQASNQDEEDEPGTGRGSLKKVTR